MCEPQFGGVGGINSALTRIFDAPGPISAASGMLMISCAGQHHRYVWRRVRIHGAVICVAAGAVLVTFAAAAQDTKTEPQLNIAPPSAVQSPVAPQLPTAPRQPASPQAPTAQAPTAQAPTVQAPAAQPPSTQPLTSQPPNANYQPGFIDAFGRFIGESASKLDSQLKSTNETLGNLGSQTTGAAKDAAQGAAQAAVGTAKEAAGVIIGLPSQHIVTGRERCAAAANGAPDCRSAADAACRAKGFAAGKSLDTQSAQKCPARVWLSGRLPADGDCQLETFVTRAVCQ
jgi:type IV secretory pathway VirB10-like protein